MRKRVLPHTHKISQSKGGGGVTAKTKTANTTQDGRQQPDLPDKSKAWVEQFRTQPTLVVIMLIGGCAHFGRISATDRAMYSRFGTMLLHRAVPSGVEVSDILCDFRCGFRF